EAVALVTGDELVARRRERELPIAHPAVDHERPVRTIRSPQRDPRGPVDDAEPLSVRGEDDLARLHAQVDLRAQRTAPQVPYPDGAVVIGHGEMAAARVDRHARQRSRDVEARDDLVLRQRPQLETGRGTAP